MTTSLQDRPRFAALVSLATESAAAAALEAWDIGEQEAALSNLVDALLHADIAVSEQVRGQLAVLAEAWGVWEAVSDRIAGCRSADEDDAQWHLVGLERAEAIRTQLIREIGPGHVLNALELAVWMTCSQCDDVLVRAYAREPWGVAPSALHYAVVHPTWRQGVEAPPYPVTKIANTPYEALDHLNDCQS